MDRVYKGKAEDIFSLMNEYFTQNRTFWVVVSGMSMYPLLREDIDKVELTKVEYSKVKRGDIILFRRKTGEYVLHRVYKKRIEGLYCNGDGQRWIEGPIEAKQVCGRVIQIKRKNRLIASQNIVLKIYVNVWFLLKPFRYKLLRIVSLLRDRRKHDD